jgi:hypothetical protein
VGIEVDWRGFAVLSREYLRVYPRAFALHRRGRADRVGVNPRAFAAEHERAGLLHQLVNELARPFEFRYVAVGVFTLRGEYIGLGRAFELIPLFL